MGGSLAELQIVLANNREEGPQQTIARIVAKHHNHNSKHRKQQLDVLEFEWTMHEKLLEETRKDTKTDKVQLLGHAKEKPKEKPPHKQSKLAERLRRSFRHRERSPLELKREDSQDNKKRPAVVVASQVQLPGLGLGLGGVGGGGHINTALLLDSPDECTPPEFAYEHLSSVATNTNSSSSLESSSCYDLGSQSNIYYWSCQQSFEMGGELSSELPEQLLKRRNEAPANSATLTQSSIPTAAAAPTVAAASSTSAAASAAPATASRSCSLTSESSSVRITRLQNFLFKSSNESTRSFQGHSNDGFTASSYNSSSGEWEQLGTHVVSHDLNTSSFPEETANYDTDVDGTLPVESSDAGAYYQYTLTSPNNPFLPEITARTYHSTYEQDDLQEQPEELQRSTQMPTPSYSRAGSQESTYSEAGPQGPTPSPASSSSSTPGRHRRKLFSLNSPTRLLQHKEHNSAGQQQTHSHQHPLHHHQQQQQQQHQLHSQQRVAMSSSPTTDSLSSTVLVHTLNPFLPTATSPIAVPADLRTKRDEFLRATMKICLVVSPPTSKLQLKSKSLTHLDGLDTVVPCHHEAAAPTTTTTTTTAPGTLIPPLDSFGHQQQHQQQQQRLLASSSSSTHEKPASSAEYFSVSFCLETPQLPDEEFIPAIKGRTLQHALRQALDRRNLSFSQITVTDSNPSLSHLDTGAASSLLDEHTDVESLAGHHLVVTERDNSRKTLQKAASFGSRQRPPRLLSSASTEETSESTGKQIKQRWSSIFGIKNPQQSQLYELLNNFAKNGVPQRPDALGFEHATLSDSLDYLQNMDKTWRDFVDSDAMSDSEIKIQTAIWELVTTEVYYIHALQTVTDLFLACLEAVQEERLLIEVDQHRLFSNIRSVCEANIKFWTLWLYPMVAHSVRTREPLKCAFFQEGFITFASTFAPYKVYCAEQSTCQFYCKELNQNNALFTAYLAWCESQKMCNRLRLADIVVRPMQRLTKYSLLLTAIRKQMDDVEEIEVMDIMIHSVENFVGSVNNHLTMRQESERLKGVMARIESYEVVDTNNEVLDKLIKQHSQMFDLCAPMRGCPAYQVRHLFMEGDHKFKDNVSKSDVHCFLLTDILLVCKTIARKGLGALKVIRQPYLTDHLIVHLAPNNTLNCVYLNEFHVATTAFTLQCTEAKNWYDALWRAKTIYQRLKRGISGNGGDSFRFGGSAASAATGDSLGVRKSPINSSMCSHVSSANNSHSGSVEWNDSRNISVDFEKTNSLSSDDGFSLMANHGQPSKGKQHLFAGLPKPKIGTISSTSNNTLSVQPVNHLGQSLPNLSIPHSQTVPLRRGMAFSTSTKNPPLLKTRNITSQNSINWHQIPATPTPPSPRSHHNSPGSTAQGYEAIGGPSVGGPPLLQKQISHQTPLQSLQRHPSNETDV
ncbi:pleckstrin homology domain-containing family G member 5 isoform X5 [Drosophila nasuta]|uniref:pleckstrin homology domain-containing family G member 5 isoform X5 n=1 Tax=Drosophila nasuta TaxID=42062 RepID=UPI00295E769D|nr:pleckstrin homology domain-containing family G member 5 isoform X5 [Drosophila nasuta]